MQRLGFRTGIVCSASASASAVREHLASPSWARRGLSVVVQEKPAGAVTSGEVMGLTLPNDQERILVLCGGFYCDVRLLRFLAEKSATTLLIDSAPPLDCARLWQSQHRTEQPLFGAAALVKKTWLSQKDPNSALMKELWSDACSGLVATDDAAQADTYVAGLSKHVRPVFFPAPSSDSFTLAETLMRETAQNGVLDIPGWLHSPTEDQIVDRLCRTHVTPNQVTFVTALVGVGVAVLFVTGFLWLGVALGYLVGVLDGVDGKLARLKVETTPSGKWEHVVDYFIELSWWIALAWHFHVRGLTSAFGFLLLLVGSDLVHKLAKGVVRKKVGRSLDDVSSFDRFVRWIGARRNVNICILAAGLLVGHPAEAFVLICGWTAATAAIHAIRALQIWFGPTPTFSKA